MKTDWFLAPKCLPFIDNYSLSESGDVNKFNSKIFLVRYIDQYSLQIKEGYALWCANDCLQAWHPSMSPKNIMCWKSI